MQLFFGAMACRAFELLYKPILFFALPFHSILPTAVAHGDICIVSAKQDLSTLGNNLSAFVDTGVYNRLFSAGADGFDLGNGIGNLKQSATPFKQVGKKIRAKSKAKHGYVKTVHDAAELVDLLSGEKLTFVGDDRMIPVVFFKCGVQIGVGEHLIGICLKSDARADLGGAVTVVQCGLDEPDAHAAFLIIEFCDQCVGGF